MSVTEKEFGCPHGVVFARRTSEGAYYGAAPETVCTRCAIEAIFGVGPSEMFPRAHSQQVVTGG